MIILTWKVSKGWLAGAFILNTISALQWGVSWNASEKNAFLVKEILTPQVVFDHRRTNPVAAKAG